MLVSVVIPTHNRVDYLKEAIDSVLRQTFTDFEIIVVLDHCTDDTRHELNKLKLSLLNQIKIRVFENTQEPGANVCRNLAAENAVGDWLAFLDDDDLWLPNKLEIFHDLLKGQSNLAGNHGQNFFYHSRQALINGNLKKISRAKFFPSIQTEILKDNCIGITSAVIVRKDFFKRAGGFDEFIPALQDWELWIRLAPKMNLMVSPIVLTHYRLHSGVRISRDLEKFDLARVVILKKHLIHKVELEKAMKKIKLKKRLTNFLNL